MDRDATAARSRSTGTALVVAVAIAYCWVAGHFTTFTRPAEIATFIPGLIGVLVVLRLLPAGHLDPIEAGAAGLPGG